MRLSPRLRRLRSDHKAMEQLAADSQILDFSAPGPMFGGPPEVYRVRFQGLGLWRSEDSAEVLIRKDHQVVIRLGASYPRMMPEIIWKTPIFHPNISANGVVCLGGYSTHWVPSLQLDELCTMLWDMIRYENFDVDSPYNRAAAQWTKEQTSYRLPVDSRPLRNMNHVAQPTDRLLADAQTDPSSPSWMAGAGTLPAEPRRQPPIAQPDIVFVDDDVIDAEIVEVDEESRPGAEILFID